MKWCSYMNMWCSDMDDEDIEIAGCDGECNCCDDCEDSYENEEYDIDCNCCNSDYNQEIVADVIRYHTSGSQSRIQIPVYYCPKCGRKLN